MPTHNTRTLPDTALPLLDITSAAACLLSGGLVLFPTETYFGIGSLTNAPQAVDMVYQVKNRQTSHPLPMVAATQDQAAQICLLETAPARLLDFWPGPLTLLLPCRKNCGLAPRLVNRDGLVAVRVSPHPLVSRLCLETSFPLTASSANISGQPAASQVDCLAPALLANLAMTHVPTGLLLPSLEEELPAGGAPSTIVRPLPDGRLAIHREGAIAVSALQAAGFACIL